MNHSAHAGFTSEVDEVFSSSASAIQLESVSAFPLCRPPHLVPIEAVRVGNNPDPLSFVFSANVNRSDNTPPCIEPHLGKVSEHADKSSSHKER